MSLDTDFGKASVVLLCTVFGLSRAAYYEARRAVMASKAPPMLAGGARASRPRPETSTPGAVVRRGRATLFPPNRLT
jgi:hypothetical protein